MSNCNQISIPCLVGEVVFTLHLNFLSGFSRHRVSSKEILKSAPKPVFVSEMQRSSSGALSLNFVGTGTPWRRPPELHPRWRRVARAGGTSLGLRGFSGLCPQSGFFTLSWSPPDSLVLLEPVRVRRGPELSLLGVSLKWERRINSELIFVCR